MHAGRRSQRPQQQISVRERTPKLPTSARTLSTEDSINSNRRCRCSRSPLVQAQRSSTSSNSRRNLAPAPSTARERRKSLQRLHHQHSAKSAPDQVQVEVEIVQDSTAAAVAAGLRHQLTSDGDDTLNNIRVPSLERDEEAAREEVSEGEPDYPKLPIVTFVIFLKLGEDNQEDDPDETEPLLIQSTTMIEMTEAEER